MMVMMDLKEANVYPGLAAAGLVAGDELVPITDHNTQHVTCRHVISLPCVTIARMMCLGKHI